MNTMTKDKRLANLKLPKLKDFNEVLVGEMLKRERGEARILFNEDLKIRFIYWAGGSGRTEFWYEVAGKNGWWSSFDRTGVEDSFYWTGWDKDATPKTTNEMLKDFEEQIERVKKQREYGKSAISVPQIGFTCSPERKVKDAANLAKGGYVRFTPSGFGTGYTISRKPYGHSNRASAALEEFYGVKPLYVTTMDCD